MKYPRRGQNVTDSDRCWNRPCFNYDRDNSKLDEWREFCKWIEELPYSQLITGGKK